MDGGSLPCSGSPQLTHDTRMWVSVEGFLAVDTRVCLLLHVPRTGFPMVRHPWDGAKPKRDIDYPTDKT